MKVILFCRYNNSRQMEKENRVDGLNGSTDRKLNCKFVTEEAESELDGNEALRFKVECLEAELRSARERQSKLRLTNSQLSTMVLASNQQSSARTQQYLKKVEEAVLDKLRLTYRNSIIDQKISEVTDRNRKSNSKSHARTLSNWSTLSSCPSQQSRPSKRDIRERLGGVKRMERQLCALQ